MSWKERELQVVEKVAHMANCQLSGSPVGVLICFLIGSALLGSASLAADTPAELGLAQSLPSPVPLPADAGRRLLRSYIADHAADADAHYLLGYVLFPGG